MWERLSGRGGRRGNHSARALGMAVGVASAGMLSALSKSPALAADVTSTWNNSTSVWSASSNWVNVPALGGFPNNGNGGVATYDAVQNSGVITLDIDVTINKYNLTNGTLQGASNLTLLQLFTWSGGTVGGTGGVINANGGILLNANSRNFTVRTINSSGLADWQAGSIGTGQGAMFNNSGTFTTNFNGSFVSNLGGASMAFNNTGTFRKTGGTGSTTFNALFNNTGSVFAEVGTIALGGGTSNGSFNMSNGAAVEFFGGAYNLGSGATFTGAGFGRVTGTVSIDGPVSAQNFEISSGTLTGTGNLTITSNFNWTGGTISGFGTTTLPSGATFTLSNGGKNFTQRTINNAGTATWSAGNIQTGLGAIFNNTGSFTTTYDGVYVINLGGTSAAFVNSNLFTKSGGAGATTMNVPFINTGTVVAGSGTISFTGGGSASGEFNAAAGDSVEFTAATYTLNPGAKFTGSGTARVAGSGTLLIATGAAVPANYFEETAGTLDGGGTLNASTFNWTGGQMIGSGVTNISGTFTIAGGTKNVAQRMINNNGAATWSAGSIQIGLASLFTNNGTLNNTFDGTMTQNLGGTSAAFVNPGLFTKSGGTGTTTFNAPFINTGTVTASSGTIAFAGGGSASGNFNVAGGSLIDFPGSTYTLNASATVSGAGTARLSGGTLIIPTGASISMTNFQETSGVLDGGGTLGVTSLLNWTGGDMSGTGVTNVGGAFLLAGGTMNLRQRTINNNGTATWSSGVIQVGLGGTFKNNGTFTNTFDGAYSFNLGSTPVAVFNNVGQFTKSGGTGITNFTAPFINSGTVNVNAGTLALNGGGSANGSFNMAAGATVDFMGAIYTLNNGANFTGSGFARLLSSGTLLIPTGASIPVNNFEQSAGTLDGGGTLSANSFNWTGGTMQGTGVTNVNIGGTLTIGGGSRNFTQRTFNNSGAGTWSAGSVQVGQGATFNNNGSLNNTFDGNYTFNLGGTAGATFNNPGQFTKSGGTGTTSIGAVFNSSGIVSVNSGTLNLAGGGTSSGGFNLGAAGTLSFTANHTLSAGSSIGGAGAVTVTGATVTLNGAYNTGSTTVSSGNLNMVPSAVAGGKVLITKALNVSTANARLDLSNNGAIVDYDSGLPIATIGAAITHAFNPAASNHWLANGIASSSAAADTSKGVGFAEASDVLGPAGGTFLGKGVDGTAVLMRFTVGGDANLDGVVNFTDLVRLAQHYGSTGNSWAQGDFTYDGSVDFSDLVKLAQNYGQALPSEPLAGAPPGFDKDLAAAFSSVPEPGSAVLGFAAASAILFARRRHRNSRCVVAQNEHNRAHGSRGTRPPDH